MDFEIVEAALARNDVAFCGLIGSCSKALSFRRRLSRKGFSAAELAALTSPVGLDLGGGKLPMEVAISAVAQVMRKYRQSAEVDSGVEHNGLRDPHLSAVS